MREIRIKFVGFWNGFDSENNFIMNILKKKYKVIICDSPQYIFSSCFSEEYLEYDCVRIFYTGECLTPDFNAFDYAISFDYMLLGDRYIRFPNYCIEEIYQEDCKKMLEKHLNNENLLDEKSEFCSFVVSKGNAYVDSKREAFFKELCEYKKVNSGGRYLNNVGIPNGVEDKYEFQKRHKFSIAFENTSYPGYVTEKIVQAFAAKTIPIYWGDPLIVKDFNSKAFINCSNYTFSEVISRIKEIDNDNELYMQMLNEPAMVSSDCLKDKQEELEQFLFSVIEQPYEKAFRRDRVGYGRMHCDELNRKYSREKKFLYRILNRIYS